MRVRFWCFLCAILVGVICISPSRASAWGIEGATCGKLQDIFDLVQSRGYVYLPAFTLVLPRGVADRSDFAILTYVLDGDPLRERVKRSNPIMPHKVLRVIRTDADAVHKDGWACIMDDTPINSTWWSQSADAIRHADETAKAVAR